MTYFWRKQHLFKKDILAGATSNVGILRSAATRHMSIEATLLGKNADLSEVSCQFMSTIVMNGTYGSAFNNGGDCCGGTVGKMYDSDSAFGIVPVVNGFDLELPVTGQTNDDSTWALRLSGWEIPLTERITVGAAAAGLQVRNGLKTTIPTTWTTMHSIPLASGKVVAIRAFLHALKDDSGSEFGGARRWFVLAKNVAGTVTIIGDTANGSNAFADGDGLVDEIGMSLRANAGTNAVDMQCNGNGDTEYSLFIESALIL